MTAAKPQDHKQKQTASTDATGEQDPAVQVTFDGHEYTVHPARMILDVEALEAFADIDAANPMSQATATLKLVRITMGDEYAKFKADQVAAHGTCTTTALGQMLELIGDAAAGNSSASPTS